MCVCEREKYWEIEIHIQRDGMRGRDELCVCVLERERERLEDGKIAREGWER